MTPRLLRGGLRARRMPRTRMLPDLPPTPPPTAPFLTTTSPSTEATMIPPSSLADGVPDSIMA